MGEINVFAKPHLYLQVEFRFDLPFALTDSEVVLTLRHRNKLPREWYSLEQFGAAAAEKLLRIDGVTGLIPKQKGFALITETMMPWAVALPQAIELIRSQARNPHMPVKNLACLDQTGPAMWLQKQLDSLGL